MTAEPVTDIRLTKDAAEAAGIFLCALAAEHGVYAGKRRGYLCGDRTGQDPDGLPAKIDRSAVVYQGRYLRRYRKSGFGPSLTGGARWQRKKACRSDRGRPGGSGEPLPWSWAEEEILWW